VSGTLESTNIRSVNSKFLICWCCKVDDIEAKLDVLIEMYKADRQTGTTASDDTAPPLVTTSSSSSSFKLLHGPPLSLRRGPDDVVSQCSDRVNSPLQPTVTESVRCTRPLRPMLRNLSDLGPRVTGRSTALRPPVSVLLTSDVSPTDEHTASINVELSSPTPSSPSSRHYPSTICESNDEVDRQHFPRPHDDDDDVIELLPLPADVDDDMGTNHVAPQQFVDHVSSSNNMIGRTVSSSDNSQSVIVL